MRVRTDISQTWKMLERAQDFTVPLQTPQVCSRNVLTIALHLPGQVFELRLILDIVIYTKKDYRAYIILADHRTDSQSIFRSNKLDNHHLAEFLIERHILHEGINVLLRSEVWCCLCRYTWCQLCTKLNSDIPEEIGITTTNVATQYRCPTLRSNKLG